ncbi:MAG: hypothetical protein B7Z19_06130, partial [Polynucleobacter sp. 32-46-5]
SQSLLLSTTSQAFTFDGNGAANPSSQTVTIAAAIQNLPGTPAFTATAFNSSGTSLGQVTLGGSGTSRTLSLAQFNTFANTQYVTVTCSLGGLSDSVTINRVADGLNNSTGYLTNENHTVATNSSGTGGSYTGAGGSFIVFRGTTQLTSGVTFSVVGSPSWITINSSTGAYTVTDPGADLASATLRATITLVTPNIIIDRVYTIAKARAGVTGANGTNGLNNAIIYLYQRAAAAPAAPSGTFTYTFSTGVLSGGTPGSWTQTIPANNGQPLWVIAATASSNTDTDTIAATEFSSPVILSQDGGAGLNSATVFLYRRSATTPAVPSTAATYTFATGVLTGQNNSWVQSVPSGTDPIYVITASAASTTGTDTIAAGEWSTPSILAQNGAQGATGATGAT